MLWVIVILLAAVPLVGGYLFFRLCMRRAVPDYWDEAELARFGSARKQEILSGKAWLEGRRFDPVWTRSDDERRLDGVLLPRRRPKGTVLCFHDCRASWKLDFSGVARFLHEQGYQLLLIDQRAHGRSKGRCITYGVWERFDVRAWVSFAAERYGEERPLYLYGKGMGATAALMASALELPGNVRGIIAEGGFTSPYRFLEHTLSARWKWPAVRPLLALLNAYTSLIVGFGLRDRSADEDVRESPYPILLIHGEADEEVPVETARQILAEIPGKKRLLAVEGAGHGAAHAVAPELVEGAVAEFLEEHLI